MAKTATETNQVRTVSYNEAVTGKGQPQEEPKTQQTTGEQGTTNEISELMNEIKQIKHIFDFTEYIGMLRDLKRDLLRCTNNFEILSTIMKYSEILD